MRTDMLELWTPRLRLMAIIGGSYCACIVFILAWPLSAIVPVVAACWYFRKRESNRLTTLGSSRWADGNDLRKAKMFNASSGLVLGRIAGEKDLVRLPNAVHTAIFGPTGAGKGVSFVIPSLLTYEESAVVIDFKGEAAKLTASHRFRKFGHRIVVLDPYKVVTHKPDTYNPLDFIDRDHRLAIDDCNDLATELVVRTGRESERHWNDSAESVIAAAAAAVVAHGEHETRSLQTVRAILCHPQKFDMAIKLMLESNNWGGALAELGGQLMHFADKEKSSVLSSALRHLRFLGTPAIASSVKASSFDPADLRKGRMTIYLVLPPERATAQAGLLRMWTGSLLRACIRGGLE